MRPVRVLVVDDSATMRSIIARTLESDPQIQVVGRAADPLEARSAVKALDPDVITLDVEMPNMNGIDFLEKIMRLRPTPVIMVSNLTGTGAAATLRALEIGAFDCVAKPTVGEAAPFAELPGKVKAAAEARTKPAFAARKPDVAGAKTATAAYRSDGRVVAIGSSTGGVEALLTVLADFPANCPPTVITQHMPATFTRSFADRLDRATAATVTEAADGDFLQPGHIYLAPGGGRHFEVIGAERPRCRLLSGDPVNGHRPSVDVLFRSVAKTCGARSVGVILTGMGRDGADGLREMAAAGAMTLGQDAGTSLVYGMPKVAFDIGAVAKQLPLQKIGPEILNVTRALERQ